MTVSKIVAGEGTKKNHRLRRELAKRIQPKAFCKRHNQALTLHGTQLICDECRLQRRKEKSLEKQKQRLSSMSLIDGAKHLLGKGQVKGG